MTTQEIATKWAEYCQTGRWDLAQDELYHPDAISLEMEGAQGFPPRVEGLEGLKQKGAAWGEMVEQFHGIEIEGPIVAGNKFVATMKMDVTMKGQPRKVDEEIGLFTVKDGKIVSEQFFYDLPTD